MEMEVSEKALQAGCKRALKRTRPHVDQQQQTADDGQRLEEVIPQEVARRMGRVDGPEVVDEDLWRGVQSAEKSSCLRLLSRSR